MKSSINKFIVLLDEESRVFSPGEHVHGKVVLDIRQSIKVSKINLVTRGEAYVSWPENNGTYTRYHYAREELFQVKACVYGDTEENTKGKGSSISVLNPSAYTFSFRFTIPCKELPPSYEAKHGYIRYGMQASIEKKKGKTETKTAEAVFTIGNYHEYDEEELAELKEYELPFTNGKETTVSLRGLCFSPGSVNLSAHTNKILYYPGEVITTRVTTDNEAYRGVCTVEASLVRMTVYNDGKNNQTYSKQEVVRVEKEDRAVDEEHLELVLPAESLQPTMLRGCERIAVNYYVQVRIKLNGKYQKEPVLLIPVILLPSQALSLPKTTTTTQSGSDFKNDSVRSNSVSTIKPGTLFFVTGSPYENQRDISARPLRRKERLSWPRRVAKVTPLVEPTSGAFCLPNRPSISHV